MKQKELCLSVLLSLGVFSTLRAAWTAAIWFLGPDSIPTGTASYNLLYAMGAWLAWWVARRIPAA